MIQLPNSRIYFFGKEPNQREANRRLGDGKSMGFRRVIIGIRAAFGSARFGIMAGSVARLAVCAFALALAVAEARAQVVADVDECALGTDTCGEHNLCGNTDGGFVCGQECPSGFVRGSARTECAETCDAATHMIDADNYCVPLPDAGASGSQQDCIDAGWSWNIVRSTLDAATILGTECVIPYRNASAQNDESGCWASVTGLDAAKSQGSTTATRNCWDLFDLDGIPSFTAHNEGDRYVHTCPDGKEPDADLKSCVCPSGYVENRAGACVDINECAANANTCGEGAACVNTVGGHACFCETGYAAAANSLQNPQCGDIDECAAGTDSCGQNDLCGNTVGAFTCTPCPAGFAPGPGRSECAPAQPAPAPCPRHEKRDENGNCFCDTETHIVRNGECLADSFIIGVCSGSGWSQSIIRAGNGDLMAVACAIPYRNATTGTNEAGCILRVFRPQYTEHTTATHLCWDLFTDVDDAPQKADRKPRERFLHTCPAPKILSDDLKSCVCRPGFEDRGGACVDIDECAVGNNACGENGACANTRGSYTCSCADGYASESPNTLQCGDVDECAAGTDNCGADSLCTNIAGGFACGNECPEGLSPNADRTECVDPNECPAYHIRDSVGGECVCNTAEARISNGACVPADTATTCQTAGWSVNTHEFLGNTLDVECLIPLRDETAQVDETGCLFYHPGDPILAAYQTSASKTCHALFADDLPMTLNHDEGDRYVHTCPGGKTPSADWKTCVCPDGQAEDGAGVCADINECATGAHSCGQHANARCANTNGAHICVCDTGYATVGDDWTLLNPQCADVDECAAGTDSCGANSLCENTVGGFACGNACPDGLVPNAERTECVDPDACPDYHIWDSAGGQCVCNTAEARISDGVCVPTGAATACQTAGWSVKTHEFLGNILNVECVIPLRDETAQVDESGCLFLPSEDASLEAYQTDASETCYDLFGDDIPMTLNHNEGDRYVHSCPGIKTPDADYKSCVCPSGHMENDEGTCVDIDECATGSHSCEANASCVNTIGGHACSCNAGYAPGDDWTFLNPNCGDVDECAAGTDDCGANALCANTPGGYVCGKTCADGLRPNPARTECVVCPPGETRDETGACICDPETRFYNPGASGACQLTSDGAAKTCMDAGWNVMTVSHNSVTLGAVCSIPYRDETAEVDETGCSLWQLYSSPSFRHWDKHAATSQRCRDLFDAYPVPLSLNYNEGDRYVHSCPAPKAPSADLKSCDCPAGYAEDDEGTCVDINECETDAHTCGANAACVNTAGSHACSCNAGYAPVGDSLQNLQCADIDECAAGAHSCGEHENAFCANTVGDYECSCYVNHLPLNPDDPKNPQCLRSFDLTLSHPVNGTLYAEHRGVTIGGGVNYVSQGATVSLTAQPDAGFYLLKWNGACAEQPAAAPAERGLPQTCQLTINAAEQVGAIFERAWGTAFDSRPPNGALSAQIKGGETLRPGDIVRGGTTVVYTAQPDSGFYLLEWGGNCAGQPASEPHERGLPQTCQLTLNAETTVAAAFERAWETTFNQPPNGTLSAEVKDGKTLQSGDIVQRGTTVIYTALPDPGYYLLEWTDHCEHIPAAAPSEHGLSKECELIADESREVGAIFARVGEITFNAQPPNGTLSAQVKDGDVVRPGDVVREGTTVIFTAQPDAGHYLLEWTGDCENEPDAEPHERGLSKTCELPATPSTQVGATFKRAWQTTFDSQPPNGALSAETTDGKTLQPGDIAQEGTTIIFTAQPDSRFYLLEWGENCAAQPAAQPHERGLPQTCQLTLNAETTVAATFKRAWQTTYDSQPANGTLSAQIKDGETLQSGDIAPEGTIVTFTAQPDPGFYLSEWGGHCETRAPAQPHERGLPQTCGLTLNAETTVAATFERAWETTFNQPPNGTLSAKIKDGETLRSDDIVRQGTTIIYTAQPDPGFYLLEWTDHCEHTPAAEPSEHGLSKECELIADESREIGAIFARVGEIAFNAQPSNGTLSAQVKDGETLRPGDVVREGTTVIFTAQPDAGHYLLEWTGDCEDEPDAEPHERGLSKTCELSATPSTQVGATFKRAWQTTYDSQPPNGALSAENADGETLQSGDITQEGTTIIFTAQPDSGFYLLEWGGHCAGQLPAEPHERGISQTCELTLHTETTVAATFKRAWQTTYDSHPPNGALSAETTDGETLQSGDIAQEGTTVIFTAQPDSGFYLLEWGGNCAGQLATEPHERGISQTCELTLNVETTVAATFERAWETTFNQPDNGTLSAEIKDGKPLRSGDIVRRGTTIIYTALPAPGHYLLEWTDHCEHIPAAAPSEHGLSKECELIADESREVGAVFARVGGIAFNTQPLNGTLSAQVKDGDILRPGDVVREGTTVIFTAQPDAGHYLLEWTGDCEDEPDAEPHERGISKTCELPATPLTQVGATFKRAWQTTFDSQPPNGALSAESADGETLQPGDIAQEGTTIIFTAQPDSGFYLLEWGGHCAGQLPAEPHERGLPQTCELTLHMETTVAATFERAWQTTFNQPDNGTLSAEIKDGETLRSGDIVRRGTTIIYTAQPAPGHYLLEWTDHCEHILAAAPSEHGLPKECELIADEARQVGAVFARVGGIAFNPQPPNGTLSAQIKDGETLRPNDVVREGTTVIFTAQPDAGHYLLEWTGDCENEPDAEPHERGLSKTCELSATPSTQVGATFKRAWQTTYDSQPPNGALSAETTDGETLQPGDIAQEGTTVIFTAQPDSGFYLLEWGGNCAGQPDAEPHERGISQTCELTLHMETTIAATFERAWETTFNQPDNGTLSAEVKDGKTLQSGDIVQRGTTIIYTAQPDPGHYLLEWTDHCKNFPAAAPSEHGLPKECELIADEARQVGAVFARVGGIAFNPQPPNGTLSAQTQDGETLRPNDVVREGTTVIFTAQPDAGHYLLEWTGDCEDAPDAEPHERGLSKTCELPATPSTQVGATFKRAWQTTFDSQPPNGALSAESADGETLQSGDIAQEGTTIIFTAQPDSGFYLLEWGGHCAGQLPAEPHERGLSQTCQLTLNAETTIAATFKRAWQTTFDSQPANGALSAETTDGETLQSSDIAQEGTTIIFTAQPDPGFYLLEWGGNCAGHPAAEPRERGLPQTCQLTLHMETTIAATFKRAWQTTYDSQPANGTLSAQIKDGETLRSGDIAPEGTIVTFTAQPDPGFYLSEWGGHCAPRAPAQPHERGLSQTCGLTLNAETTVAATFERAWETTFSQPDNGTLSAKIKDGETLRSGDIVRQGTTIIYTAQPDPGFYLLKWTDHCEHTPAAEPSEHGLSKECELIADESREIGAVFARIGGVVFNTQPLNGTLSAQVKDGDVLRPGDVVREGTTVIFTAQPDAGHYLLEWTGDCEDKPNAEPHERGLSKTCELSATPSTQVGATFKRAWQTTFDSQPSNGALSAETTDGETLQSGDITQEGTTIIFTAQPDSGFYLLEWGGHCAGQLSAEPHERGIPQTCELTLNAETTIAATFKRAWQTTYDSHPPNGALSAETTDGETLQSGDIAQEGTTVIFTAQPDSGFYLLEWGGNCAGQLATEPHERGISQTCELTLNVETTVAATFERAWETTFNQPDNGTLSAEIKDGKPLRSGDIVRRGTTIIYTALPAPGHYLLEWTDHCEHIPAAAPSEHGLPKECELIADEARQVGAIFARVGGIAFNPQPPNGALSAQVKDGETLRPNDVVREGTTVIFTAQPDAGHYLLEWTGDCENEPDAEPHERGLSKTCELSATPLTQVGATFKRAWQTTFDSQPPNGALSAETTDGETLQSADIAQDGTTIIFTAQPDSGFYLLEWGGHCAGQPPAEPHERGLSQTCELTLNVETTVAATFKRAWQTTFDSQPPNGALSAESADGETLQSGDITQEGTTIIFTAQPDSGFYLLEWGGHCAGQLSAEPHERGISQTCELTLNVETTVAATFKRAWQTTYDSQPANGTLSAQIKDGETLRSGDIAPEGTIVTFTAQPDPGFYLSEWGGHCETRAPAQPHERGLSQTCGLTLNAETTVAATFERAWETTFSQPDNGTLSAKIKDGETLRSGDIVRQGTTIIYTAQPDFGFYLLEWTDHCEHIPAAGPSEHGLSKECELIADESREIGAVFARVGGVVFNTQPPNGTLSAQVKDGETLRPGDVVREGTTVIFTAQPDAGHYLLEWTGDCEDKPNAEPHERGLSKTCELSATPLTQVGATFKRAWQTTYDSQPANGTLSAQIKDDETLQSGDIAQEGTTIIFTAQPDSGFYLLEWGGHCAGHPAAEPRERGLPQTCQLTLHTETTVAATFKRAWQTTFDSQPDNGALSAETTDGETLQSGDSAPEGTTIIFTAQPDSGFYLLEWGGNCAGQLPAEPHERGLPQTCELTLHMETTVAAAFERAWQTTFNQPNNGTLSAEVKDGKTLQSGGAAREGMTVVITAQPAPGFYLLKWTGDCDGQTVGSPTLPGAAKTCELTADSQKQFGAVFERASETMFNPAPQGGRLSARIKDGAELTPGERTRAGTTIIFTARPDPRYYLLKWTGDCEGEPAADPNEREQPKECEVVAGGDPQVGAVFKLAWLVNLAPPSSNLDAISGRSQGGTLSARIKDGKVLRSGDAVPDGATVVFTATPNPGFYMTRWQPSDAVKCDDEFENPERNPDPQICEVVVLGNSFEITPPAPEFNSSCLPIKNAMGDEDNPGKCVCADPAHLIFGEGENRFCAPPTICPTNYSNKNRDCIEHDANPPLPDYANSPEGCEEVFGGRRRRQTGGVEVCSGIDIQGTFCLVGSRDAFPCRGLFKHVRRCNDFNRPALNPFICDIECPGGGKTARGRYCGQETADENPNQ